MLRNIAGTDVIHAMGDFDSHYMHDGMQAGDAFRSSFDQNNTPICILVIIHIMALYDLFRFIGETSYCAHIGWRRGPAWGFDALVFKKVKHGDAGKLGHYVILSVHVSIS